MDQRERNLSILNLSLESPHGTPAGTMVLIEKTPLGEFDLLEAALQYAKQIKPTNLFVWRVSLQPH